MIRLRDAETGANLGTISSTQRDFLVQELEEEFDEDRDYYFDPNTIDMLAEAGADEELVALLRKAVGEREGVEIAWSED